MCILFGTSITFLGFHLMSLTNIIHNPLRHANSCYHFKVTAIEGNTIWFHDATKESIRVELPDDSGFTLEQQYRNLLDNLFISININGQYFFYQKLSNEKTT